MNTAKFTNMITARFRESRYLVGESKVFVKDILQLRTVKLFHVDCTHMY